MGLVKFLAVGRLVKNKEGFSKDKHQVVASLPAEKDNPQNKTYHTHLTQIMNNGAEKLKPNRRVRLTSDGNLYDLHVLADLVENNPNDMIVFFAVTDVEFAKAHSVSSLLEEFKMNFYSTNDAESIRQAKTGGQVHKNSQEFLQLLINKYGEDKMAQVNAVAIELTHQMQNNVNDILVSVDNMDGIDANAQALENHSASLHHNATTLKNNERCQYYKKTWFIALIIVVIILIIVIAVASSK